jgi:cell division protein FtsI (penicillin-binding protein 3)
MQPPRADLFDRNNKPIAINKHSYSAFIIPNKLHNKKATKAFLQRYFRQSAKRLKSYKNKSFFYVKRHISKEEKEHIAEQGTDDIHIIKEHKRYYPNPTLGIIVGATDIDNNGIAGLEYLFDTTLSGSPTTYLIQKEARKNQFYFEKIAQKTGHAGTTHTSTIDSTLQFIVHDEVAQAAQKLEASEAAAVIIDPATGDIRALVEYPGFNPNNRDANNMTRTKSTSITDVHELGSVMKAFLGIAALDEQVVTADTIIDCENTRRTKVNGMRVNTWKAHAELTFTDVIRNSNNIGTSKVAMKLGHSIYDHYKRCGFGIKTGIEYPGEQAGAMTPPEKWSKASPLSLSFGYEVSASLVQLASAFSIFANDGYRIRPRLIQSETTPDLQYCYPSEPIQAMRSILRLDHNGNTARRGKIAGCDVFGKTGTARLLNNNAYDKHRCMYTFVSLIEKNDYKRIIVTWIKEAQGTNLYAATVAVPLFKSIAHQMLIYDKMVTNT